MTRTRKQIQRDIDDTVEQREAFAKMAREETDKDYKEGLYINVDNCNKRIQELVVERDAHRGR